MVSEKLTLALKGGGGVWKWAIFAHAILEQPLIKVSTCIQLDCVIISSHLENTQCTVCSDFERRRDPKLFGHGGCSLEN